jgi:hypothetical protein
MPRVYFDINVYDRIDKGCVSPSDVDALRLALRRGNLTANVSIVDIEELLGEWETNRPAAVSKLKTARELIGFDEILNQPSSLLTRSGQTRQEPGRVRDLHPKQHRIYSELRGTLPAGRNDQYRVCRIDD